MNVKQYDRVEARVNEIIKCTNGVLASKINAEMELGDYTDEQKLEMIKNGTAKLAGATVLGHNNSYNKTRLYDLLKCFTYPLDAEMKNLRKRNKRRKDRLDEAQHAVELAGKNLMAKVNLDLLKNKDILDEFDKLAEMSNLL